jgi:hypothetical protein
VALFQKGSHRPVREENIAVAHRSFGMMKVVQIIGDELLFSVPSNRRVQGCPYMQGS